MSIDDIVLKKQILDINFHPHKSLLCAGLITGRCQIFEYNSNENISHMKINFHKQACRCTLFSYDGDKLYSAGSDGLIGAFDLEKQQLLNEVDEKMPPIGHENAINVLKWYEPNILVSGDDEGIIKIWDNRQRLLKHCMEFEENEDFIADIWAQNSANHLLAAGGDGYLSVFDMRGKGSLFARSDNLEDELLSICVLKNGKKVICGSQEGILQIFTYNDFGDISDRFPGHPKSIDAMIVIDEDTICTGSSDGLIRLVQIHPNKLLGVIGEHEDYPIEVIRQRNDKMLLASCSHDNRIKFWDVKYLYDDDDDDNDDDDEMVVSSNVNLKSGTKADFYDGL